MNNTNPDNEEEKRLVARVLKGEQSAFSFIIRSTENLVAQIVFRMISNQEDRKDIAQDVYLKVWKKLPGFRFESKLSTWIAQICYNTCFDHLRRKKIIFPGSNYIDEDTSEEDEILNNKTLPGSYGENNDIITRNELSEILKTEIENLPPVHKTMIMLFHQADLTYEEIEQITGFPAGTVKSYLFRARRTLKNNLLANYKKEDL